MLPVAALFADDNAPERVMDVAAAPGSKTTQIAARMMAVTWGTPTPATTRVVQMEPGPMPTLTASAPALIRAMAPS